MNFSCEFGSYLDPSKVTELRPAYRGNVREVLQTSIQAIVNAAYNPSIVIGFLRPGRGKVRRIFDLGSVVQNWISANPGLKFNLLF